jgi:hypothetical protein
VRLCIGAAPKVNKSNFKIDFIAYLQTVLTLLKWSTTNHFSSSKVWYSALISIQFFFHIWPFYVQLILTA